MVTVAKSLDVPIKLVFPRPAPADAPDTKSHAMLGLGDVVLPGIMIGLALRFDLFLFYLRRQKRLPSTDGSTEEVEKPRYFSLSGRWSDHFWTHSLTGRPLFASDDSRPEPPFTFPKTYFKASLIGYIVGMLTTLGVMHIWGHAQPALLYLVPGVLGSLWLTALVRGEIGLMWEFSEETTDEEDNKRNDKGDKAGETKTAQQRTGFFSLSEKKSEEREKRIEKALRQHVHTGSEPEVDAAGEGEDQQQDKVKKLAGHRSEREVFSFSIEAPWKLKHPRSLLKKGSQKDDSEQDQSPLDKDKPNWAPPPSEEQAMEPPGKRVRLS